MRAERESQQPSAAIRGILLFLFVFIVIPSCKPPAPPEPEPTPTPTPSPTPTPTPAPPTPTPIPTIDRKAIDVSRLFNDIQVTSQVEPIVSDETASVDRREGASYQLELKLKVDVPTASWTLEQVSRNDPGLAEALPGLADRLADASISPAFGQLYDRKIDYLKARLSRIDSLLSRHNFYDCETILEFQNPSSGRRALFMQGDMDVNTDGSDGDRNFEIDGSSMFFQPQTSYRWTRLTERPNQFLEFTKDRIKELKAEYAIPGLSAEKNRSLRDAIAHEQATLYEIERYSFLISGADPFIVLPGFMLRDAASPFAPSFGDYAVVVHKGITYPAIVGDAGPSFKFGEASVRLCRQINPRSSAISRPVSDLKVTYIVFPGTKDEAPGPPDLEKWKTRCADLLGDLGLNPSQLHAWENLIKPWPTPTPVPTPTPTPTPTPIPSPTATPETTPAAESQPVSPTPVPVEGPPASPAPTPELILPPAPTATPTP